MNKDSYAKIIELLLTQSPDINEVREVYKYSGGWNVRSFLDSNASETSSVALLCNIVLSVSAMEMSEINRRFIYNVRDIHLNLQYLDKTKIKDLYGVVRDSSSGEIFFQSLLIFLRQEAAMPEPLDEVMVASKSDSIRCLLWQYLMTLGPVR